MIKQQLTQNEQITIIREYQKTHNQADLLQITDSNKKLVERQAFLFLQKNPTFSLEDLISSGYEGLLNAVNHFDDTKSPIFYPYAKQWVKAKIQDHISRNITITSITGKDGRFITSNFYKINSDGPNNQKYSDNSNISDSNITGSQKFSDFSYTSFKNAIYPSASLYHIESGEEQIEDKEAIKADEQCDKNKASEEFKKEIAEFSISISPIEQTILKERILSENPKTLQFLSSTFNMSKQAIFSIENKVINKFKKRIMKSPNKELLQCLLN